MDSLFGRLAFGESGGAPAEGKHRGNRHDETDDQHRGD
jgi:hypothetical protein